LGLGGWDWGLGARDWHVDVSGGLAPEAHEVVLDWRFWAIHRQRRLAGPGAAAGRTAARNLCNLRAVNRVRAGRQQR